jgi:hypothetical protein
MAMANPKSMMRGRRSIALLAPLAVWLAGAGCKVEQPASLGECTMNAAINCDMAGLAGSVDAGIPLGLVGYSCTGLARPDLENAKYVAGIPYGMVCADQGPGADGTNGFCCTRPDQPTTCALDPTSIEAISHNKGRVCPDEANYRFQCYGPDRPEALNPALTCGNGVREDNIINYCCAAAGRPIGCSESKGGACPVGQMGWHCPQGTLPRGEDFGANESRADYYYFVCGVPGPPATDGFVTYCCFTPSPLLPGGSCVTSVTIQSKISDCGQGRFGFACYGRETPEQDYSPIYCDEAPFTGPSAVDDKGYPATLYCCDYKKANGGTCTKGDQCLSNDCTEGYCCALDHCPSCYTCALTGVPGTCRLVPPGGADPTGTCGNGCDGNGNCL